MFLGHFYKRNSLVEVLNVYLRQVKVEEHSSGQGQVIIGQLSYSYEYSRVIHIFMYFLKKEFITNGLKSVFHNAARWLGARIWMEREPWVSCLSCAGRPACVFHYNELVWEPQHHADCEPLWGGHRPRHWRADRARSKRAWAGRRARKDAAESRSRLNITTLPQLMPTREQVSFLGFLHTSPLPFQME